MQRGLLSSEFAYFPYNATTFKFGIPFKSSSCCKYGAVVINGKLGTFK